MAGIKTPGIDVDVSWPLVAGVGVLVLGIVWLVYDIFNASGASKAVGAASDLVSSVGSLAQTPVNAVSDAVKAITGTDQPKSSAPSATVGDTSNLSNSQLLYGWLSNF